MQYFGASSLQLKISRSWHEISPDDYNVLREKLIGILMSYINGPKIVLNRLSMAVSSIYHTQFSFLFKIKLFCCIASINDFTLNT